MKGEKLKNVFFAKFDQRFLGLSDTGFYKSYTSLESSLQADS